MTEIETGGFEFDFGKAGPSRAALPLEELAGIFKGLTAEDLFIGSGEKFAEAVARSLPFRARKAEIVAISRLLEPLEFLVSAGAFACFLPSEKLPGNPIAVEGIGGLEALLPKAGLVYCCPDFASPTGATMGLEERKRLLEMAEKSGFRIVEDGSMSDLRYFGEPLPSLKSMDERGIVTYVSDFSNSFLPGLGAGFAVMPEDAARGFHPAQASALGTFAARRWLESGGKERFLKKTVPTYRRRMEFAVEMIESELPAGSLAVKPQGGFYLWLKIPSAARVLEEARKDGVNFTPANDLIAAGKDFARINFAAMPEEKLVKGLRLLSTFL